MFKLVKSYLFVTIFLLANHLQAQDSFTIQSISFSGNKRTKEKVIRKELSFTEGDLLDKEAFELFIKDNEERLESVGLFNQAEISIIELSKDEIEIQLNLVENWYFFPSPIFDIGDRSFTVWIKEQGASIDRLNYGVRARHYNLTGNKDPFLVQVQLGYTRKLELEYGFPYLSKENGIGLFASIFYADNREIPYKTIANRPQFFQHPDERIMLRRFRSSLQLRVRPSVEKHHSLSLEYHRNSVDDIVVDSLNSNYFLGSEKSLQFFMLNYDAQFDKRVNYLYPYKGYRLRFGAKKEGLGILKEQNSLILTGVVEAYIPLLKHSSFGTKIIGKTNLIRTQQAFANNTGLGWSDDLVSGFDLYVLDGLEHFLIKNHIKLRLLDFDHKFTWPAILPEQFKSINLQVHLRFNFDFAYVNEPSYVVTNDLNNRWIYGYGPALDIILYNSYLFSLEYSFNDLGEGGFFVNARNSF